MKRVFIDTNVVLDFLLEREPFVEDAVRLFAKIDAGEIIGFIAATTITNKLTNKYLLPEVFAIAT
ncbi:MAG: PIN domain-containing protein [Dolichospermum sp.]